MPREIDLVLAHIALDQKFLTAPQFGKLLREITEREREGNPVDLAEEMVSRGLLTARQLETLDGIRRDRGETTLVGGYEIRGILGHGAMGCVYLARQTSMDRLVALKVLPHELARDKQFLDRFVREARSTARLNHVNIVQGYDVGQARGLNYFAMEYVKGNSLREVLNKQGKLPEREVLNISRQVGLALEHAWNLGIVHRDIKPDNIMMTEDGIVKVTDLGLAKPQDGDGDLTRTGMIVGTPNYMSPEQARGVKDIDIRSDLYSLGITVFQLMTGQIPFKGANPTVVMTRHITEQVPSPATIDPAISEAACEIVRMMCAKSPGERYQTPADLVKDCEAALEGRITKRHRVKEELPRYQFRSCYVPTEDEVYFVQIALHNRVVTVHQIQRCLELQEALSEVGSVTPLPDVLADQGMITRRHVEKIQEAQRLQPRKAPESFFGRIAVKLSLVTRSQVKECLSRQRDLLARGVRRRLGDIMEDGGYIELKDKVRVLTEQARIRQALENRRFGNIAIRFKFVGRHHLDEALKVQEQQIVDGKPVERLGTILVREGILTEQARRVILRGQRRHEMTGEPLSELMSQVIISGPESDAQAAAASMDTDVAGLFDNVKLKSVAGEACAFCGQPTRVGLRTCPHCGKPIERSTEDPYSS